MRKFRILKCPQEKTISYLKKGRKEDGSVYSYTVYKDLVAGEKDLNGEVWYPGAYGHERVKEGDIIELDGHLAMKAAANPDFEEVTNETEQKRKPGRPKKVSDAA